ncbi:hypothetical protein GCM10018965_085330 [Nonomuraea roseola]
MGSVLGVPVPVSCAVLGSCAAGKENVGSSSAVVGGTTEAVVGATGGGCTGCSCVTGGVVGAGVVFSGSGALLVFFVCVGVTVVVTVVTGSVGVGVGVGSVVVIVTVVTTSVGSQVSPASHGGTTSPGSGSLTTTDALAT